MKKTKSKIITIIATVLLLILVAILLYLSQKQEINYTDISSKIQKNTSQNIDMEYLYSKNVGINIKQISISENTLNFIFNFKLQNKKIVSNLLHTNIIIYDEDGKIYGNLFEVNANNKKFSSFYNTANLEEKNNLNSAFTYSPISTSDDEVTYQLLLYSPVQPFSHGKKLYIHIYNFEYTDEKGNIVTLTPEWNFSIDTADLYTPAKKYKLKENVDNFTLHNIYISDSLTSVIYESNDISNIELVDSNGNSFKSFTNSNKYFKESTYKFNTNNITQPLYLRISNGNSTQDIELEEIK